MPPAHRLLRLLALLLAAVVALQGLAAAQAVALGTLHVHVAPEAHDHHDSEHHHHHDDAEHHHHGADDVAIEVGPGSDSFDRLSLTATLPSSAATPLHDARRHVQRAALSWAWHSTSLPLPRKPPRLRA